MSSRTLLTPDQVTKRIPDAMPIGDARAAVDELVLDHRFRCPCCGGAVAVHRRHIGPKEAKALIRAYHLFRVRGRRPERIEDLVDGDLTKCYAILRYWRLVVEADPPMGDPRERGWWLITDLGIAFAIGGATVPSHAAVRAGRLIGLIGVQMGVVDCFMGGGKARSREKAIAEHAAWFDAEAAAAERLVEDGPEDGVAP